MQLLCARMGITHLRTSAYHPQTDGKCERVQFLVHDMVTKLVGETVGPTVWERSLWLTTPWFTPSCMGHA